MAEWLMQRGASPDDKPHRHCQFPGWEWTQNDENGDPKPDTHVLFREFVGKTAITLLLAIHEKLVETNWTPDAYWSPDMNNKLLSVFTRPELQPKRREKLPIDSAVVNMWGATRHPKKATSARATPLLMGLWLWLYYTTLWGRPTTTEARTVEK